MPTEYIRFGNLIGQRTREALARKKAEGVILGRPKGRKFSHVKLSGKEEIIKNLREHGVPINEIARIYKEMCIRDRLKTVYLTQKIHEFEAC